VAADFVARRTRWASTRRRSPLRILGEAIDKAAPAEPASKSESTSKKPRAKSTRAPKVPPVAEATATPAPAPVVVPRPPHRMVFIDVENTSSEADLLRVLDELQIRELGATTELTAIGNWRVVGQGLGRSLAARGAHLVHSAPAVRVSDWSDLWIAVHAGIWLGRAQPGDTIEIVSHDRAFDAVGDAATRLGITFRRVTYRGQPSAAEREQASADGAAARANRRRGGRGRRIAVPPPRSPSAPPPAAASPAVHRTAPMPAPIAAAAAPTSASPDGPEPHSASHEQLRAIIARLTTADPGAGVGLDRLTVALKAAGFQRPPGSPRLVTRLRRLSDLEVLPSGRVRLRDAASHAHSHAPRAEPVSATASAELAIGDHVASVVAAPSDGVIDVTGTPPSSAPMASARPRSRRRGGRRRRGSGSGPAGGTPAPDAPSSEGG
jgi:hypothetical protein